VIDGRMSKYWMYACLETYLRKDYFTLWAFPEWINDPYYYGQLVEGDVPYVENFARYRMLMDKEFPHPSIEPVADIGDENWLICPACIDAWESSSLVDALTTCPGCKTIYNNPRYYNDDSFKSKIVICNE
jgi:hypothetical protein